MNKTSMSGDLTARLQRKIAENRETGESVQIAREEFEGLAKSELQKLGANLQSAASDELRTFASATAAARRRQAALLAKDWFRTLAVGTALLLGISLGSWGLAHYLAWRIESQIERSDELAQKIEVQRRTLQEIENRTWGIRLHEGAGGKYVVLPAGTLVLDQGDRPRLAAWTVGERPAVKLLLR